MGMASLPGTLGTDRRGSRRWDTAEDRRPVVTMPRSEPYRLIRAKYAGKCAKCAAPFKAGTWIYWQIAAKKPWCSKCGDKRFHKV